MRGGDANAAIYWLARMLQGGEDQRLIWFACQDVGLADLNQSVACCQACQFIGMQRDLSTMLPLHLRNAPTKLMKEIRYNKGYISLPNDPLSSSLQTYLPSSLQCYTFLNWPGLNPKSNR
ncbi:hypothetical protein MKW92_050654 [Papaver armeniacum]|nr:hypothetical protein MKW92_050654 [Papaver armeniacum]